MEKRHISTQQLKDLVKIFSGLNDERQKKVMEFMLEQQLYQTAEDNLIREGKKPSEKEIVDEANERAKKSLDYMDKVDHMNDEQKAALLMFLEKYQPGAFTQKEEVEVRIRNRTCSLEEAIKSMLPGVDIAESNKIFQGYRDSQEKSTCEGQ